MRRGGIHDQKPLRSSPTKSRGLTHPIGGRGGTLGILSGVLLLTMIHVGLAIVYVPSFYVTMIGGVLIFIAVAVDALRVNVLGKG